MMYPFPMFIVMPSLPSKLDVFTNLPTTFGGAGTKRLATYFGKSPLTYGRHHAKTLRLRWEL